MKPLRIYSDTSVIGGCFDTEFEHYSLAFIDQVQQGIFKLLFSQIVLEELETAPLKVQGVLTALSAQQVEFVPTTPDVIELRNAYLEANILTTKSIDDATHVALATVHRADAIVSWNFKHIVRLDKIKMFNQVNLSYNYGMLTILSPMEVLIRDTEA